MANSIEVLMDVLEYIEINIAGELSVEKIAQKNAEYLFQDYRNVLSMFFT